MIDFKEKALSALADIVIKKFIKNAILNSKFLSFGPVGFIFSFVVMAVGKKLLAEYHKLVIDLKVNEVVDEQVEKAEKVLDKLEEYENNKGKYSEEEQDELDDDIIDNIRELIKF